jgi:uncharacterized protein (TIGR02246 family)
MRACQADRRWTTPESSKNNARMTSRGYPAWALAFGAGLFMGCGPGPALRDAGARQAIETAVHRYVAASNQGDARALADLYAEDAMLLPPDHEPVRGREAIGAYWSQGTDEGLEVTTLAVEVNGDLGYLVGRYNLPATEEEPADSGKYVMCLKRQRDGAWKLTADIWNQSGDADDEDEDGRAPAPSII